MSIKFDYAGQVVIVTGGSSGIGEGITLGFLGAGAKVIVCDRNPPPQPISAGGNTAEFLVCDVCELDAINSVIAEVMQRHGRLDVLVNNAGGGPPVRASKATPSLHETIIRLNLIAPLNFAQAANAVMQKQEQGGVIIFIGSICALRPAPGTAAYSASKAGIVMLGWGLSQEWAPKVRVMTVSPGLIHTPQSDEHYGGKEVTAAIAETIPMRRMGTVQDITTGCLMVAAPEMAYATGSNLYLQGGGEPPEFQSVVKRMMRAAQK